MNILIAATIVYVFAGVLGRRRFVPTFISGASRARKQIATVVLVLLWPLWLPFGAYALWDAHRSKVLLLAAVGEIRTLIARKVELTTSIDRLVEELANEDDDAENSTLLGTLEVVTARLIKLEAEDIPAAWRRAYSIYRRHSDEYDKDRSLPKPADWEPEPSLQGANTEKSPSRLSVEFDLIDGKLSASSAKSLTEKLNRHWFRLDDHQAAPRPAIHVPGSMLGAMDRLNQRQNAQGDPPIRRHVETIRYMRSKPGHKWTLTFSKTFEKSLNKAGKLIQERARAAIHDVIADPLTPRGHTKAPLGHDKRGKWKYRIGDYRIIYLPIIEQNELFFVGLSHRKETYQ